MTDEVERVDARGIMEVKNHLFMVIIFFFFSSVHGAKVWRSQLPIPEIKRAAHGRFPPLHSSKRLRLRESRRGGMLLLAMAAGSVWAIRIRVSDNGFPPFLPKEVGKIRDPLARKLAMRIERLPVKISFSENFIMSSCVKPRQHNQTNPVVLLHGFDSSCLEWRSTYPLLENAGLETWAVDILGWGFSNLEVLPSCGVPAKREHLYQLWRSYIQRPMVLVGPSLGAAVAIDFTVNHPEAVTRLILIDASVFAKGTGKLSKLPRAIAYAGASLLKCIPLRLYANTLAFNKVSLRRSFDWTNLGRLHCLQPWWEDATVDFMLSGGYNVSHQIKQIKQKALIIWGEDDNIISNELALRLHDELPDSVLHLIPECGHLPHVEKPEMVADSILKFVRDTTVERPPLYAIQGVEIHP